MTNIFSTSTSEDINKGSQTSRRKSIFDFRKRMQKYRKSEDGSILVFALFTIILMMMIGGLAIDVMRAERQRTKIQYTGDRATLAAASLKQTESAQDIFDDYFAKDGIGQFTPRAVSINGLNSRRVTAVYDEGNKPSIRTFFIDTLGINELATPASSAAEDGVGQVEISLVLDVSGSMGGSSVSGATKIADLKDAAKEFVDTLLADMPDGDDTFSISIVPYSTQVTVGETLLSKYWTTDEHDESHCVDFVAEDFTRTNIDLEMETLQRTGHFSPWTGSKDIPADWWTRTCIPDDNGDGWTIGRHILPLTDDIDALENYIDDLFASGWTSTEIGIKWGATMLDPSTRPVVSSLVDDDVVPAKFRGRPYDYTEQSILKVMVVMTDGENTNQYFLDQNVATGPSPVWYKTNNDGSIRKFWVHNPDRVSSKKYRKMFFDEDGDLINDHGWKSGRGSGTTRLTYQQLWDLTTMRFVSDELFGRAERDDGRDWRNWGWHDYFSRVAWAEKDARMENICSAAKANNILLFTIGFEVSDNNAAKLISCATTPAHFFRVEGVEISDAFASIAAQLSNLRLIQ